MSLDLITCSLQGSRSAIELREQNNVPGAGARAHRRVCNAAASRPSRSTAPTLHTIHVVKELIRGKKKPRLVRTSQGFSFEGLWKVRCASLPRQCSDRLRSSVPHYSWRANHNGQSPHTRVSRIGVRRRCLGRWHRNASVLWRRLIIQVVCEEIS